MIVIDLPDEAATATLAARLAALAEPGDIIALNGELGAGKTTFARAFLHARGHRGDVPSPTFTLVQQYETGGAVIWHFDGYRLRDPEEAWELGIEDAFYDGISLIEWPDRFGALLPPSHRLDVALSPGATPTARQATLDPRGDDWSSRLSGFDFQSLRHPRESGGPDPASDPIRGRRPTEPALLDSRLRGNDG